MSNCLRCGVRLPPTGDCPACARPLSAATGRPPSLLDRDLHLDRRLTPPSPTPAVQPAKAPPPLASAARQNGAKVQHPSGGGGGGDASGPTEIHARPAPLWRRAAAFAIDAAAVLGVVSLYLVVAIAIAGRNLPESHLTGLDWLMQRAHALEGVLIPGVVLAFLLATVYSSVLSILWDGRTLGCRALKIQLVDESGLAPAPPRAVVRAVLAMLSFLLFCAGFWLALFDRRGQTLHDKLTSTFIVEPI